MAIVPQSTPGNLDDWADESADLGAAFQPLIEGCHAADYRIALQMSPGAGAVDEYATAQLDAVPQRYARAARGARDAGFDAIDIHGQGHSLLMRLLSPLQNQHIDKC